MRVNFACLMAAGAAGLCALTAAAQDAPGTVAIAEGREGLTLTLPGGPVAIARSAAGAGGACPPACIQPMTLAPGIATLGEIEVLDFLAAEVAAGTGLILDVRLPDQAAGGTIPGAVNLPHPVLAPGNPLLPEVLAALGAPSLPGGGIDTTAARRLALVCGGAWSPDCAQAAAHLLSAGWPAERLLYYRGGMDQWRALGLTIARPGDAG